MAKQKFIRYGSLVMAIVLLLLVGFFGKNPDILKNIKFLNTTASGAGSSNETSTVKIDYDKLYLEDGSIDISQLTPVKVAEIKQENGRSVIYYNGKPYLYYAMHVRWDHLLGTRGDKWGREECERVFEECIKTVKNDGFDTVVLYTRLGTIFDGEKYDFSDIEFQYNMAKKYDMKIHWNMFGHDVCGSNTFMLWQTDREKYPSLKNEDGEEILNSSGGPIPDLSNQIFLDETYEIVQQFCAWLNAYDLDRRTVAIQLENEVNPGTQETAWMGQFKNFANYLDNLGRAVKESTYSMITYTNVMSGNENLVFEGLNHKQTMQYLIDRPYLDIVGWDTYTSASSVPLKVLEHGNNIPVHVEFSPAPYSIPGQLCYGFANGQGFGFYQAMDVLDWDDEGYLRSTDLLARRDGTQTLPVVPHNLMGGKDEINADELALFNKSIKAISELIATQNTSNIMEFNIGLKNDISLSRTVAKEKITFNYKNTNRKYGSSGLTLKANDGNFYVISYLESSFKFTSEIKEVTAGTYKDGKWTESGKVTVTNNTFTTTPGLAYRVSFK